MKIVTPEQPEQSGAGSLSMSDQALYFQKIAPRQISSYRWQTRKFSESEYKSLIGTINSSLATLGFALHNQGDFFFVYEKDEKPDGGVVFLLLLMCILPGILYLLFGHRKSVVSIQVFETDENYLFDISAPSYALLELDKIFSRVNSMAPSQNIVAASEEKISQPEDTKKCPYCAETIKAKAIKCKHCGSILDGSEET